MSDMGYARRVVLDGGIPTDILQEYLDKALVVWRGKGIPGHAPLASIGTLELYVMERARVPTHEQQMVVAEPILCARRGGGLRRRQGGENDTFVGIDDEICSDEYLADYLNQGAVPKSIFDPPSRPVSPLVRAAVEAEMLTSALELIGLPQAHALVAQVPRRVRIAIIDDSFAGLPAGFAEPPCFQGLPRKLPSAHAFAPREAGHGTRMVAVVREALGADVDIGTFSIVPHEAEVVCSWIAATDLALTLAHAIEQWKADLVLIPMSDGHWGVPRHLQAVLRESQRVGAGGQGIPIFCSVGDFTRNHHRGKTFTSYALGADELASQPWVFAISSTDTSGRWYRRFNQARSSPINRFGPSVAFCAPGEMYRLGLLDERLADDSSVASALVVACAALVQRNTPDLTSAELRTLFQMTADLPPITDEGPGPVSERFNAWDREGHNFKLGSGRVNALTALLAIADPICFAVLLTRQRPGRIPSRGVADSEPALLRALAWYGWTLAHTPDVLPAAPWRLLEGYLRVRGRLARLIMHSRPWREALLWMARHVASLWMSEHEVSESDSARDHGALLWRLTYLFEVLRSELRTPSFQSEAPELLPWLTALETLMQELEQPGETLRQFFCGTTGAFEPLWLPPRSGIPPLKVAMTPARSEGIIPKSQGG